MVTLLLVLSIVGIVVSSIILYKTYDDYDSASDWILTFFIVVFIIGAFFFGIWDFNLLTDVSTEKTLDAKIEMYQIENASIEESVDTLVKSYMEHEYDTFENLKTDKSLITLVTLFPDLKSDSLVQKQLDIYVSNNEMIKKLKKQKIEIGKERWLLYFGS